MLQSAAAIGFYAIQMAFEVVYWRRRSSFESGQQVLKRSAGLDLYALPLPYLGRLALTIVFIAVAGWDWRSWFGLTATSAGVTVVIAVAMTFAWLATGRARRAQTKTPARLLLRYLGFCVLWVGGVEELMFRGVLLLGVGGGVPAWLLSSAAHSAWHFQWYRTRPISYVLAFGISLVFGATTLLTGSLWPAIAMHGLGDFIGNADRA